LEAIPTAKGSPSSEKYSYKGKALEENGLSEPE